jgi:hypothetical protein
LNKDGTFRSGEDELIVAEKVRLHLYDLVARRSAATPGPAADAANESSSDDDDDDDDDDDEDEEEDAGGTSESTKKRKRTDHKEGDIRPKGRRGKKPPTRAEYLPPSWVAFLAFGPPAPAFSLETANAFQNDSALIKSKSRATMSSKTARFNKRLGQDPTGNSVSGMSIGSGSGGTSDSYSASSRHIEMRTVLAAEDATRQSSLVALISGYGKELDTIASMPCGPDMPFLDDAEKWSEWRRVRTMKREREEDLQGLVSRSVHRSGSHATPAAGGGGRHPASARSLAGTEEEDDEE